MERIDVPRHSTLARTLLIAMSVLFVFLQYLVIFTSNDEANRSQYLYYTQNDLYALTT